MDESAVQCGAMHGQCTHKRFNIITHKRYNIAHLNPTTKIFLSMGDTSSWAKHYDKPTGYGAGALL